MVLLFFSDSGWLWLGWLVLGGCGWFWLILGDSGWFWVAVGGFGWL